MDSVHPVYTDNYGLSDEQLIPSAGRALHDSNAVSLSERKTTCGALPIKIGEQTYRFTVAHDVKPKIIETIEKFSPIMELQTDWDSYGAAKVDVNAVLIALKLLAELYEKSTELPIVSATSIGGVHLEWEIGDRAIEIDITPTGELDIYLMDENMGIEKETTFFDLEEIGDILRK